MAGNKNPEEPKPNDCLPLLTDSFWVLDFLLLAPLAETGFSCFSKSCSSASVRTSLVNSDPLSPPSILSISASVLKSRIP